jgi:hypothetical protein
MKHTSQRTALGTFLIIGTLLALYIIIEVAHALYWGQLTTLMHRMGVMQKIGFIVLYTDIILLFVAGRTSAISFFRKKPIWKPITKGIIVNLYLWLSLAGLMVGIAQTHIIFKFCSLLVIGLVIWLMSQIWKMIRL